MSLDGRRKQDKFSSERGVALLLLISVLTTVLLLVGVALIFAYYWVVRSQVQAVTDAAAQNAAAILGRADPAQAPTQNARETWQQARESAIGIVNAYLAQGSSGFPQGFVVDPQLESPWTAPNLEISIERGRWLPATANGTAATFESFEGDWQAAHPGMPAEIAGNAIRVEIKIPALVPLVSWVGGGALPVESHSIGMARASTEVMAAPFAIPVCSLLNAQGDLDHESLCIADRLLTSSNRYCPATDPNCAVIPDFSWDPFLPVEADSFWPYPIAQNQSTDNACFWATPHFAKASSNFGVIGLPGISSPPQEQQIQLYLSGPTPGIASRIGDPFWVLAGGLSDPASNEILWRQIVNGFGGALETHPAFELSDLQAANQNKNMAFKLADPALRDSICSETNYSTSSPITNPRPWRQGWGTCNSMRAGWGRWSEFTPTPAGACLGSYRPPEIPPGMLSSQVPLWRVPVAVIADPQGPGCQGASGAAADPPVAVDHPYEVIGFIDLNVYDVDIGSPSPAPSHPCSQLPSGFNAAAVSAQYPWGFQRNPGTLDSCNLVRTRIACDTEFVASSRSSGPGQPLLVE